MGHAYSMLSALLCERSITQCVQLFTTAGTVARQVPLSMGLSRQEGWSGLPRPPPGDLPDPGIDPLSLASPASAGSPLPLAPPGKPGPSLHPILWSYKAAKTVLVCLAPLLAQVFPTSTP